MVALPFPCRDPLPSGYGGRTNIGSMECWRIFCGDISIAENEWCGSVLSAMPSMCLALRKHAVCKACLMLIWSQRIPTTDLPIQAALCYCGAVSLMYVWQTYGNRDGSNWHLVALRAMWCQA